MVTIAETLQQAWRYHQSGDLTRAEQLYRQLLRDDPSNAQVLFLFGAVNHIQGKLAEAEAS
jgi:Tfp pilus assembly protein PilF